ncbi:hypothetical protein BV22DRAFT_1021370, partial [Leucogyrophana mollusca]
SFTVVDKESFRALLKYQRPQTRESDIPHRTKLREEILTKAAEAEVKLCEHFKIGWATSDNATTNDKAMRVLQRVFNNTPEEGEEVDEVEDFDPGDLLGKVLALITQVRLSPQAKTYFATICKEEGLTPLELIKWIRTRWGSMADLIEHLITNRLAVDKFCLLADSSSKVPKLKNKKYADYKVSPEEWEMLNLIQEVLKVGFNLFLYSH